MSFYPWWKIPFRLWRWPNMLYANALGYFWLPCPICTKMFGGHEASSVCMKNPSDLSRGWCVCWRCGKETNRRNEAAEKRQWHKTINP